jgi:hypothetical protein
MNNSNTFQRRSLHQGHLRLFVQVRQPRTCCLLWLSTDICLWGQLLGLKCLRPLLYFAISVFRH